MSKNCDTCINFIRIKNWTFGRLGICDAIDCNITYTKGKPCKYHKKKKYKRRRIK